MAPFIGLKLSLIQNVETRGNELYEFQAFSILTNCVRCSITLRPTRTTVTAHIGFGHCSRQSYLSRCHQVVVSFHSCSYHTMFLDLQPSFRPTTLMV